MCDLEAGHGQLPAGRLPASTPLPLSEACPFFVQPPPRAPSEGRCSECGFALCLAGPRWKGLRAGGLAFTEFGLRGCRKRKDFFPFSFSRVCSLRLFCRFQELKLDLELLEPQRPLSFSLGEALGLLQWPRDRAERLWDGPLPGGFGLRPTCSSLPWASVLAMEEQGPWVPLAPLVAVPVLMSKCQFKVTPPPPPSRCVSAVCGLK